MKNKYGNYVIFKILSQADSDDKQLIMQCLIKCLNNVANNKYRNRWITFIEENPLKIPNIPNISLTQPKPSIFKNSSQNPDMNNDSYSRNQNEMNIPEFDPNWEDQRQQTQMQQNQGYSQFYNKNLSLNPNQNPMNNMMQQGTNQQYGFYGGNMQQNQQQLFIQQQFQQQQQTQNNQVNNKQGKKITTNPKWYGNHPHNSRKGFDHFD